MNFQTKYRRLLHTEFDELLDADENIYVGPMQAMNKKALADRVSAKWAFDEKIRANSKAKYGKDEVVRVLRTSIKLHQTMIEGIPPTDEDAKDRSNNYTRIISKNSNFETKERNTNMPRASAVTKTERSAPSSSVRPKLVSTRPEPVDEPVSEFIASREAARLADDYDAIRIKLAEFEAEKERIETELIQAMKLCGKKNFGTMHGRVSFMEATGAKDVSDEKAAVALLASHGIPQPPTLEVWLAQHKLQMPTKSKPGLPDRIKFETNK